MNTYKTVKLYLQNWEYADENGQQEDYRASLKANIACKEAVEAAIVKHYHVNGYTLDTKNCAKELILEFGLERLAYVLAIRFAISVMMAGFHRRIFGGPIPFLWCLKCKNP